MCGKRRYPAAPKPLRDHRYLDIALNLGDELRSRLHRYTLGRTLGKA
jgi:hypothetical protein